MNKLTKILLAIIGGCDVLIKIMTPIAVVLFWCFYFNIEGFMFIVLILVGGLSSLLRGVKIGTVDALLSLKNLIGKNKNE